MKKSTDRIPELDGIRVIMIFIVSWYHLWQQSWLTPYIGSYSLDYLLRSGYIWVDGTVLLSAFLLFLPYARVMLHGGTVPDTRDFYRRRACRILPSWYFIILLFFFAMCLPWHLYTSPQFMVKDLATHFTFTFNFWADTYISTPLGAAPWTLAVEVQAYILFPWIAKSVMKHPVRTLGTMLILCLGFRAWCIWSLTDYSMVVNQLIDFLDVYVLGILLSMLYVRMEKAKLNGPSGTLKRILATVIFLSAVFCLLRLLRVQAASNGYTAIQRHQMEYRPLFTVCFGAMVISCPFALLPLRFLLGNPVMRFLSAISMNYYLVHQTLFVQLRRMRIPFSESDTPNITGDRVWQAEYTWLCFGLSLILAVLITYLIEKPVSRLLRKQVGRKQAIPPARIPHV
ncbi:MAG: acyltransferase [Clostridia bacterium]|nr:acyltransferase [Clostridia bacterium]